MNMDVDVDAQRAASHTEISARSSAEFQDRKRSSYYIRTQVRRSRVQASERAGERAGEPLAHTRLEALHVEAAARCFSRLTAEPFPFIVIRENETRKIQKARLSKEPQSRIKCIKGHHEPCASVCKTD